MIAYAPHTCVIHHTAGMAGFAAIRRAHKAGVYDEIAYNVVIERDGQVKWGRPLGTKPAANAGKNAGTIAVALVGDNTQPGKEWTLEQSAALSRVLVAIELLYPGIQVIPHSDLKATECPGRELAGLIGG